MRSEEILHLLELLQNSELTKISDEDLDKYSLMIEEVLMDRIKLG